MPTIKELKNLIKDKLPPAEVLAKVAEAPIVNSFEEKFKGIAGFIDLSPTTGKEDCFYRLRESDNVIYWKTAENDVGVEIIGIVWDEKGEPEVFCGTLLPP